jgi:hypothetical protein
VAPPPPPARSPGVSNAAPEQPIEAPVRPLTLPPPPRISSIPPEVKVPRFRTTIPVMGKRKSPWASAAERAADLGDAARSLLPGAISRRVERAPGSAIFAGVAALGVAVLVGLGVGAGAVYRSFNAPASQKAVHHDVGEQAAAPNAAAKSLPGPPTAKPDAATRTRDEGAVLLDLADSLLAQHLDGEVPSLLARLVTRRPELKDDARLKGILLSAAGSKDFRAASESFELLSGAMGESGAALLYELSLKRDVSDGTRRRAERWLASKDFERVAALPVFAAQRLRSAKTCEAKLGLLDFAADAGGKYVLDYLHELDEHTSCAANDLEHCYPCLRSDNRLHTAIAKLER